MLIGNHIPVNESNLEQARKCLSLISSIAKRGACSQNPDNVGYALQELTQVLLERTGKEERVFEPMPGGQIPNLPWLYTELDFVEGCSQDLEAAHP